MRHTYLQKGTAILLALCLLPGCTGKKAADETQPGQTAAVTEETTVPETTPETTVPETTSVPETTVPETTPETTVPETTPETTVPPQTQPEVKPAPPVTEAPKPPETEAPKPETAPYYVKVNCETNTVTVYTKDENGDYTVPAKAMVCSSGLDESPTPTGTYRLTGNRWGWLEMVGGVWGQYVTQIIGNYLFHSVPYTEYGNHGSLQEGEYDKLGEDASHGCIRLTTEDAKWIYDNMWNIQGVELYNSPDPGPLGKPTAQKIGDSAHPDWDPTDYAEGNPWHSES